MKVLITGSSGYLGGHVTQMVRDAGYVVETKVTQQTTQDLDACIHLGWLAIPGDAHPNTQKECLRKTSVLLDYVRECPRFVFASTASVYGNGEGFVEEQLPTPTCAYTRAKVAAEALIRTKRDSYLIMRMGSLMGAGVPHGKTRTDLVVNAFASQGWAGGPIEVWDPDSIKPIIHIRDAANLIWQGVEWDVTGTYNTVTQCVPANAIALEAASIVREITGQYPEIIGVKNNSKRGTRSTSVNNARLLSRFPEEVARLRTVRDAVMEFAGEKWVNKKPLEGVTSKG